MSVIGLDIGNESCVIAAAKRGGVDILLSVDDKRETPSVVAFGDKQRFLGSAGAAFCTANPKSTITQIKRLIGRQYTDPSVQKDLKLLPYATSKARRGGILVELEYLNTKWAFSPVEILGMLFTHLKQVAEKSLESPVADCVIGIPCYFTDLQRREYLDAARVAGLRPLNLIHDGTAIALGYGMYKTDLVTSGPTVVVFLDIGHCDTQVTVAAFEQGGMVVLTHSFDPNLGGRDFDEVLFRHFVAEFMEKYSIDVYSNARASVRLRASCEKAKKVLSANAEAAISIDCLIGDTDVRGSITRGEFEKLSRDLLERVTVLCCKAVYDDARVTVDRLYAIELVGSGSRIPAVMKRISEIFHKEPTRTLNASECVARGCALGCAMLSPSLQVREYKVRDFFPYTIGLPIDGGKNKTREEMLLFPKGCAFPSVRTITYRGDIPLRIQVFYTDKTDIPAGLSAKVGHFMIGLSQSPREDARASFNVKLNDNGVVEIESASILEDKRSTRMNAYSYLDKTTGNTQISNLAFSRNLDFATTEIELYEAQQRARTLADQDEKIELSKDQRNALESFVYNTRNKLSSAYGSFASDSEKKEITDSLQKTEDWLYEDSDDEYEQDYTGKLNDLKKLLKPVVKRYEVEKAKTEATKSLLTCIKEYSSAAEYLPSIQKKEVRDFFPYTIGLPIDGGKNKTREEMLLFPKGCAFPSVRTITYRGDIPLRIQVFYTDKTDIPAGLSAKVGHFMIGLSQSPREDARASFNVKLNDNGVVEIESASILEDKRSTRMNAYSYLDKTTGNTQISNLAFSRNLDFATTEIELYEAQQRARTLADQDEKIELSKDQRNALESFVYNTRNKLSSAYGSFASDSEKKEITDSLQKTEDWLYEDSDDEYEQDYTGKLNDLKKLLKPVVKRYEVEKAKTEATKSLLTCIKEYSSAAEYLPSIQKKEVNNVCIQAEQFLYRVQNHPYTADPVDWSSIIKYGEKFLNWSCKNIMTPIQSFPIHSNERDRLVDSNQRYQAVDVNQTDQHEDTNHGNQGVVSNQNDQSSESNQMEQPAYSNQMGGYSNQSDPPVDSNQMGLPVDSNQMGPIVDSDQKDKHEDLDQTNQSRESNQMEQPADSNQMGGDSNQSDLPVDSNQMGLHVGSNQMGPIVDSDQKDKHEDSDQTNQSRESNQMEQPADSNQMGGDSNQSDPPVDSNQMGPRVDSDQKDKQEDSDQRDSHLDSNQMGPLVDSNQMGPIVDSYQKDKHENSDQRDSHLDSNQRDHTLDSDQKDQPEDMQLS